MAPYIYIYVIILHPATALDITCLLPKGSYDHAQALWVSSPREVCTAACVRRRGLGELLRAQTTLELEPRPDAPPWADVST